MSLKVTIETEYKNALKSKDKNKISTYSLILSSIKSKLIEVWYDDKLSNLVNSFGLIFPAMVLTDLTFFLSNDARCIAITDPPE